MDVRDHDSRGGLADSARRRARHCAGARQLSAIAGRHGAYVATHRCGGLQRARSRAANWYSLTLRRGNCWRLRATGFATATGAHSSDSSLGRAHSRSTTRFLIQSRGARRNAGAPSRCTWAERSKRLPLRKTLWRRGVCRAALRAGRAAHALRCDARARGQTCAVGVLPRAERVGASI